MSTNTTTDKLIDVVQQMLTMIKDGKATPPKANKQNPVKIASAAVAPIFQDITRRLEIIEDILTLRLPDPTIPPPSVAKKKRTRR